MFVQAHSTTSRLLLVAAAFCAHTTTLAQNSPVPTLPSACQAACPTAYSAYQAIPTPAPGSSMSASDFQAMYIGMLNTMCQHKSAFSCVASSSACSSVNGASNGSSATSTDPQTLSGQLDCICTACPAYIPAFGKFYGGFLGALGAAFAGLLAGTTTTQTTTSMNLYATICPMVHVMPCLTSAPQCSATLANVQSPGGGMTGIGTSNIGLWTNMCNAMGLTAATVTVAPNGVTAGPNGVTAGPNALSGTTASTATASVPMGPFAAALLFFAIQWRSL